MKTFGIFSNYFGYSIGGSEYSIFKYLQEKESAGWKIIVFLNSKPGGYNAKAFKMQFPTTWEVREYKLPFQFVRFRYISYVLNKYTLSKIVSSMHDINVLALYGHTAPAIVKRFNGKSLFFVRDEYALGLDINYYEGLNKFLFNIYSIFQYPFKYFWVKDLFFCFNKSKIIANSRYIANLTKSITGKKYIQVVYPDIDFKNLKKEFLLARNPKITKGIVLIGDHVIKGSLTFRRIAEKMPYLNFYIFDKKYKKMQKISNITLMPWTSRGMLFNHANMILMPSHINEAFGRSIIEARSLGIPVLSSDKGGLPEAIGDEFFLVRPIDDIDQWIAKIKITLDVK